MLPALDLSLPIGLGYDLIGRSSVDSSMNYGAGDLEFGVSATYRTVWEGSLTFTHFFGQRIVSPSATATSSPSVSSARFENVHPGWNAGVSVAVRGMRCGAVAILARKTEQ